MNFLSFEEVEGLRKNSKLIWIPEEKNLYFYKDQRASGTKVYLCYENRSDAGSCPARRSIDIAGVVSTNGVSHSNHSSHEIIYENMKSRSAIIDGCIDAARSLDGLHMTIPNQQIFTREIAK